MKSKLPSKPIIGLVAIAFIALATWSIGLVIGSSILGRQGWSDWQHAHAGLYFLIWGCTVVVIALPTLWLIGTKLAKAYEKEEAEMAAARGVGRLAARALQGKKDAKDRLVELLDDETVQIRCQAARALMLLSEPATDRELERKIRYWPGDDKLALIENLKGTRDMRAVKLMTMLAEDRNPIVARRARSAMVFVAPRTTRLDGMVRKQKEKDDRRAEKKARREGAPATAAAPKPRPVRPAADRQVDAREAPPKRSTPLKSGAATPSGRPATRAAAGGQAAPSSAGKATRPAGARRATATKRPANARPADTPIASAEPSEQTEAFEPSPAD